MKPRSWKTTTWGIVAIVGTIASAAMHYHTTGQLDLQTTITAVGALAAGAGLIPAADHSNIAK